MDENQVQAALWLQEDARYLYAEAAKYRDGGTGRYATWTHEWLAIKVQNNAAHSARLVRRALGIEP